MGAGAVVRGLALGAVVLAGWGSTAAGIGTILTDGANLSSAARPFPIGVTIDPAAPGSPPEPPDAGFAPAAPTLGGTMPAFPGAGDGSDGPYFANTNTNLAAGTYDFTSFTVADGATVQVDGAATILVQGETLINGVVFSAGDGHSLTLVTGGSFHLPDISRFEAQGTGSDVLVVAGERVGIGSGAGGSGGSYAVVRSQGGDVELRAHGPDGGPGSWGIEIVAGDALAPNGAVTLLSAARIAVGGSSPTNPGTAIAGGGPFLARAFGGAFLLTQHGQIDCLDGFALTVEATGLLDLAAYFGVGGFSPIRLVSAGASVLVSGGFSSVDGDIDVLAGGEISLNANDTEIAIYGSGDLTMVSGSQGLEFNQQDCRCYTSSGDVTLLSAGEVVLRSNASASSGGQMFVRSTDNDVYLRDSSSFTASGTLSITAGRDVYIGKVPEPSLGTKPPPGGQGLISLGGDATVRGSRVEMYAEGSVTIDAAEARATGSQFSVQAIGRVDVAGSVSAAGDLFLVSMEDGLDLGQATLVTDTLSAQPAGMIVAESWNPDATIDARFATITSGSGGSVPAEVHLLVHGPPSGPVASFLLPKKVSARADGPKSRLVASGFFDTGPDPFDFAAPATVTVGGLGFNFPGLEPAGTSYRYEEEGLILGIKPARTGSSRARFRLVARGEAVAGAFDPDSDLALGFDNGAIDGGGRVGLEQGRYTLGRKRGALKEPAIWLVKATAALRGEGTDLVSLRAGFATEGATPEEPPAVTVRFGDAAPVVFDPGDFLPRDGDAYAALSPEGGTVFLDYARETITFQAGNLELGDLPEGPQPVTVSILLGDEEREVSVRMVRKGRKLRY